MRAPRCSKTVAIPGPNGSGVGACYVKATQRVVGDARIQHRCDAHAMTDAELAEHGWRAFPVEGAA